jgi:hypothetical protein
MLNPHTLLIQAREQNSEIAVCSRGRKDLVKKDQKMVI